MNLIPQRTSCVHARVHTRTHTHTHTHTHTRTHTHTNKWSHTHAHTDLMRASDLWTAASPQTLSAPSPRPTPTTKHVSRSCSTGSASTNKRARKATGRITSGCGRHAGHCFTATASSWTACDAFAETQVCW